MEIPGRKSMSSSYDLAIAGGGLSGAALAINMVQHGARVLVIERETKFKDRVRGEVMFPWGYAEAHALGVAKRLAEAGGHHLNWVETYVASGLVENREVIPSTIHQLPFLACYHPAMQESLLNAAASAGATVRRGAAVREVRPGAPLAMVIEEDGRVETISARLVVGAEGRSSVVRTSARFPVQRDLDDMMIAGILLENVPAAEDTLQGVYNFALGHLVVVGPQGGGRVRMYLCYHDATQARYQGPGDLARFVDGCKKSGARAALFDGVKQIGPLATFPCAHRWVDHPYRDGVALLGDSATSSDPTWGQGLSLTMRDARVLRDHLMRSDDWDAAGHAYASEHDGYSGRLHTFHQWMTAMYLATGPDADARRARAMPLIAQDPSRQPDALFVGPDLPVDEAARKRFFAED
jgi:2-polyprenyl-6-methoxyphenol hydroxylase-like FAD-dependent oxidoreductase